MGRRAHPRVRRRWTRHPRVLARPRTHHHLRHCRILRTETLDVLAQDFVRTAHAKGLRERTVVFVHALRNALIPVVTALGGILAALVGGALVIEQVFSWPGVGQFTFQAAIAKDYPIVQASVMFTSTLLVISYLLRDLAYAIVDPRVKVS
ncbi:MAG: ABC transporter permease [Chloroflexi bacterium]|nr:MAG: ABC transporter permease [Chloroflexota bacterium]